MASTDVVITFGANAEELQGALNILSQTAALCADGMAANSDKAAKAQEGQTSATRDATQQMLSYGHQAGETAGQVSNALGKNKGEFAQVKKDILEITDSLKTMNNAIGASVFNLGHAALQGGNAFAQAQKQIWKDLHTAALSTIKSIVSTYISGQLNMLELSKVFGYSDEEIQAALASRKMSLLRLLTANSAANQQQQTAATQAGATARQTTEVGSQAAQTAAVEAGNAARTGSDAAAAAEQSTAQSESVMTHAKSAASAVYDDVAQIPYVGWILAPAAAASAFAAVAAYSAAGGWERVPYDGALTELHKDEMVLPASVASTVRAASSAVGAYGLPQQSRQWANPAQPAVAASAASGGSGGSVTLNYTPSVSAIDTRGARDFLDQHGRYIVDVLQRQQRNFAQVKK